MTLGESVYIFRNKYIPSEIQLCDVSAERQCVI